MVVKKKPETVGNEALTTDEESAILLDAARQSHDLPTTKPAAATGVQGLLAGIFDQLETAAAEAAARVDDLKTQLATAERDQQAISVLLQIRKGNLPTSFSPADHGSRASRKASGGGAASSAPRAKQGSIQARILEAMGNDPMSAGDILTATMAKGTPDEAKYRSALFNMKKKGELGYNEVGRVYTKP